MVNKATERLAAILQDAREAMAKTQEHLAAEAGVSVQTVRRAEQTGVVSAESFRALCSVLGLDAVELRERAALADVKDAPDFVSIPPNARRAPPDVSSLVPIASFLLLLASILDGAFTLATATEAHVRVWFAISGLVVPVVFGICNFLGSVENADRLTGAPGFGLPASRWRPPHWPGSRRDHHSLCVRCLLASGSCR